MVFNYEKSFLKQKGKLLKKTILTEKQIDETIELYKKDKNDIKLLLTSFLLGLMLGMIGLIRIVD